MGQYNETISDNAIYTIFDTGKSEIMISSLYYDDFIKKIFDYTSGKLDKVQHTIVDGEAHIDCS